MKVSKFSILMVLAVALPSTGLAQDKSASGKDDDEKQSDVNKEFTLGFYNLVDSAYRFGKYSGLTENNAYALFDFSLEKRPDPKSSDTTRWRFQGWRLGLNSRRLELDFNQQGTQRFKADYREIPNYRFEDGLTPFRKQAPGIWNLAPGWEVDPNNSSTRGFKNLEESLVDLSVDTKRRRLDLAYDRKFGSDWNLDLDFSHETKKGERTLGSIIGFNFHNPRGVILPAPVDYTTDTLEAMFGYANNRVQFNFGFYASLFSNDEQTLVFQNPYAHQSQWAKPVGFPDSQGRLALEPDNSYLMFRLNGGVNFGASSRFTADFSRGSMEQNDRLLPYTINPELVVHTPVPRARLNAKINTTMLNLRLTSRLLRRMNLAVNYHYDDRDNKTPRDVYPYIGADSQDQRDASFGRINLPYSYTRQKIDATMTYRFPGAARLKAGVESSDYERDFLEVTDSEETTWLAGISFRGGGVSSFRFDYRRSNREISDYTGNAPLLNSTIPGALDEDAFQNHPLLRKFFLTDRDRDEYRLRADFFPGDQINFGFAASYFKDDYDEGYFGLNAAKIKTWSVDFGWTLVDNVTLTGFYTNEKYDAFQSSQYFFSLSSVIDPELNWFADTRDRVDTYNFALNFKEIGANKGWKGVEFGLDYTYSNTDSAIDVSAVDGSAQPLPDLLTRMQSFSVWGSLAVGQRSSIQMTAENAKLKTRDWGLDGVVPDTLSTMLLLGESAANYNLWLISASWTYRF